MLDFQLLVTSLWSFTEMLLVLLIIASKSTPTEYLQLDSSTNQQYSLHPIKAFLNSSVVGIMLPDTFVVPQIMFTFNTSLELEGEGMYFCWIGGDEKWFWNIRLTSLSINHKWLKMVCHFFSLSHHEGLSFQLCIIFHKYFMFMISSHESYLLTCISF